MDQWPLVGRGNELKRLVAAVVERRGAVIIGAAGVGKTTLAAKTLQVAEDHGMTLACTTATRASRGLPFGAFASILPSEDGRDGLSFGDSGKLLRSYTRAVIEKARDGPLVVFVDDAHLLDDGSATLLHQLAMTRAATVIATVCSGESVPDAVVSLWKDGPAERVELPALDEATVEELLVAGLGAHVDAASVRQFADRCQGNPMVLRELVYGALDNGVLVHEGGICRLRGPLRPTSRLVELVALRLGELSDSEREVLELLALGEPLGHAAAAQLVDPASVESLEKKGLIASRMDGRRVQVGLAHPVYGDVVRVGISTLRERVIARSLAEVIEAAGARRREDTVLVASLRLVGGGGTAELLLDAALAARARNDHPLTERLARAAIERGGGFEARLVAAEVAHLQGRAEQAESEMAALALDAASDAERARVAIARFDNAYLLHARVKAELIEEAISTVSDPTWRDELLARRFYVMSLASGPRATVEASWTLLGRTGPGPLTAVHLVAYSLARLGRLAEATQLLGSVRGDGPIPPTDAPWDRWALYVDKARVLMYAGRLAEAEDLLATAYAQVVAQPTAEARGYIAGQLAVVHLEQGRVNTAYLRATEAQALLQQLGRRYSARWPYAAAAHTLALSGQGDSAAEALAAHDALGLPSALFNETSVLCARAWTTAAQGDLPGARRLLESAANLGEEIGDLVGATTALHDLARMGKARRVAARLARLAEHVEGDLVKEKAAYATALSARDASALEAVSQRFEDLGAILFAAEASAEASVVLRQGGESRKAAACGQRSGRLLARCEGAVTPALRTVTARVRLTPGELDAALQAAAGHTNKQIAAKMHLSVRTVESNLQRVYEKLGISGRRELAQALRDGPPV